MVPKTTKKSIAKTTAVRKTKIPAAKTTKKQPDTKEESVEDTTQISNGLTPLRKSQRNLAKSTVENNEEVQIETTNQTKRGKRNPPKSLKVKNDEKAHMEIEYNSKVETDEASKIETNEVSEVETSEASEVETNEASEVETNEASEVETNQRTSEVEVDEMPKVKKNTKVTIQINETLRVQILKAETSKVKTNKKSKVKANKNVKSEIKEETNIETDEIMSENVEDIKAEDKNSDDVKDEPIITKSEKNTRSNTKSVKELSKKVKAENKNSDDIKDETFVKSEKNLRSNSKSTKEDISKKLKAEEIEIEENKLEENDAKKPRLDENKEMRKLPSRKRKADSQINEVDKNIQKAPSSKAKSQPAMTSKAKRQKVLLEIPPLKSKLGTVFVIGQNDVGQLGLSENVDVKTRPCQLELSHSIVDIAAGGMHSLCLTESGEVLTFGCNDEGALGRVTADETEEFMPRKVDIPERVVQVSAGDSHSAALTESGQVYIWGNFRSGEGPLGLTPSGLKQVTPITILNRIKIVKISSGNEHLVCLSAEGEVYTCGCGEQGQLGRISGRSRIKGGRKGLAALLEPAVVSIMSSRKKILADDIWTGSDSTFIKAQDTGEIYAFGLNNYNQLGFINENNQYSPKHVLSFDNIKWLQISGGEHHTLALDSKGHVYALGRKEYGRLGLGEDCEDKSLPTIIPALQKEKCIDISCGTRSSFAVAEQGSAYSWGFGTTNQLGHGNDNDCHEPRIIGGNLSQSWKSLQVSGGGQHTLILACQKKENKT